MNSIVSGVGINDSDYAVSHWVNGKKVFCPFYAKWKAMLARCYSEKFKSNRPTYIGCSVAPEWHYFSNFKQWMETQDWQGKHLDKDILIEGNKIYSTETCAFIDGSCNSFTNDHGAARGKHPLGVSFNKKAGKFQALCTNPFTKKHDYLGLFTCPSKAHQAWKKRKHELACQLADLQTDERVAQALRTRYA